MPKHYKEMMDEIINKIEEDAPANAAGSGNVAGIGVGPDGEPGIRKKDDDKKDPLMFAKPLKRKIKESDDNNNVVLKNVLNKIESIEKVIDKLSGVEEKIEFVEKKEEYKTFKDKYLNKESLMGYTSGYVDSMKPMASLGDRPPKGDAVRGGGVGITASKKSKNGTTLKATYKSK